MGFSNTMQLMRKNGVTTIEGYHRGAHQIIHLDVECTGDPKVMRWKVPTKVRVYYDKKEHIQFNTMYVCMLIRWQRTGTVYKSSQRTWEVWTLASSGAKTAHPWSMEAELARGWRWRMVAVTHQVRRMTRNV
jgi:hypothetical protein